MARYCTKCGAQIRPDSKVCPKCRTPVSELDDIEITQNDEGGLTFNVPEGSTVVISDVKPKKAEKKKTVKQAAPEKPVEKKPKKRSGLPVFIIGVLAAAILFTGFVNPGFFLKGRKDPNINPTPGNNTIETDSGSDYTGNSKAFTSSPCEGITVSAEAGAFEKDTTVKFTRLNEIPAQYAQVVADLKKQWILPIAAFEVDAGLKDDEVIPGAYQVTVDLEKLGIDRELWPGVSFARVGDDGGFFEYAVTVEGNKAAFLARQNSILMTLVELNCLPYNVLTTIDFGVQTHYFRTRNDILGRKMQMKTVQTPYGTYEIWWTQRDYKPDDAGKIERITQIEQKYETEAEDYRKKIKDASEMEVNQEVAKYYKACLEADAEYKSLKDSIGIPEDVEMSIKYINQAYDYLGRVERVRMPFGKVVFQVRTDGNTPDNANKLGEACKQILQTMVNLWPHKANKTQSDKDNYLLTITHELFHVCQERYRATPPLYDKITDDPRYDEMVTMVLERDAKKWYQKNNIITTDPPLTEKDDWDSMRLPIDKEPDSKKTSDGNTVKMREGYLLGDFVMYLQKKYPKKLSNAHRLMIARNYMIKSYVSPALMDVFGMTEEEFDTNFRQWMLSKTNEITEKAISCFYKGAYDGKEFIGVKSGQHYHVDLENDGSYFLLLRGFRRNEGFTTLSGVLVSDQDFRKNHTSVHLLVTDKDYVSIPYGVYFKQIEQLVISEVYGKIEENENMKVGYTLWVFGKTPSPELEQVKEGLAVKLPKKEGMAAAGILDGYLLTITSDGNKILEKEISKDLFETTITYSMEEIFKDTDKKHMTVSVTLLEYVKDKEGNICPGKVSDPVNITIERSKDEDPDDDDNDTKLAYSNLYLFYNHWMQYTAEISVK